ncbi:Ppx/GppA phosphatase [Desulfurobacterium thermolithotrophum DSM 11699]|uniref:Ppx/GppA phosphatase n=1 Tax=Desulfurobacterium thermolithotrophum (strain DSM 11699 / BSA) TaxID=868864 RepID=F0S479_DESTD|nr:phosphatase [Desulfurobacterium thermolithotrophum]ADY73651.1 Ppx/GppA phosphatase [Desulfurobacterium thermolithotrophum DSM 11699]
MKKIAVIDIGSNTIKLVVYKVKGKKLEKIFSDSLYARLLNYLKDKELSEEGVLKLELILKDFREKVEELQPDCTIAFATYVLRIAQNSKEVIDRLRKYFDIEVLSGEEEAYYSSLGALLDVKVKKGLFFDIGGGSLEICDIVESKPNSCRSYPLGTLSFKDFVKNGLIKDEIGIRRMVRDYVNPYDFENFESEILIGVGGSIRPLRKILGRRRFKRKQLKEVVEKIKRMKPIEIMESFGISIERAKTVAVASVVVLELMDIFKVKELVISKFGIREGIVYKRVVEDGIC